MWGIVTLNHPSVKPIILTIPYTYIIIAAMRNRSGIAALWLLLGMGAFLTLMSLAIDWGALILKKGEMGIAVDSALTGAVQAYNSRQGKEIDKLKNEAEKEYLAACMCKKVDDNAVEEKTKIMAREKEKKEEIQDKALVEAQKVLANIIAQYPGPEYRTEITGNNEQIRIWTKDKYKPAFLEIIFKEQDVEFEQRGNLAPYPYQ